LKGEKQSIISVAYCVRQFSNGPGKGVLRGITRRPSIYLEIELGGGSVGFCEFISNRNSMSESFIIYQPHTLGI